MATPSLTPAEGRLKQASFVTMSCSTAGATIRYTRDGSEPDASSTLYKEPSWEYGIGYTDGRPWVNCDETIKARAFKAGMAPSATAQATYTFTHAPDRVKTPVISPGGGRFSGSVSITIASSTPGAEIYYTLDGSMPTKYGTLYSGPFQLHHTATVSALAFKEGLIDSYVKMVDFVAALPPMITRLDGVTWEENVAWIGPRPTLVSGDQPVTWSLDKDSAALGIAVDVYSGVASWATPVARKHPYLITLTAMNAGGSDSKTISLEVLARIDGSASGCPTCAVFGADTRQILASTQVSPYNAIGKLNRGTGALVTQEWVLTAAHVVQGQPLGSIITPSII